MCFFREWSEMIVLLCFDSLHPVCYVTSSFYMFCSCFVALSFFSLLLLFCIRLLFNPQKTIITSFLLLQLWITTLSSVCSLEFFSEAFSLYLHLCVCYQQIYHSPSFHFYIHLIFDFHWYLLIQIKTRLKGMKFIFIFIFQSYH